MNLWNQIIKGPDVLIGWLGNKLFPHVRRYMKTGYVFYRLIDATLAAPACFRLIFWIMVKQIYFTAVRGLYILIFAGLMVGLLPILIVQAQLSKIPYEAYLAWLLVIIVVRELGPVLAALFVLVHSSDAIIMEIGTMSVTRETEALQVMGIDPYLYLGVPRFWAVTISVICLNFVITSCAVGSGYLGSLIYSDITWYNFLHSFSSTVQFVDLSVGFLKAALFGMTISTVSIYSGFEARGDMGEVAKRMTKGALWSLWLCGLVDFCIFLIAPSGFVPATWR